MVSDHLRAILLVGVVQVEPQSLEGDLTALILTENRQDVHYLDPHLYFVIDLDILLPFP